jgi:nucleotide-binding universal stress UspA family protein
MFSSILVPVDPGEPSSWTKALPVAISLCKENKSRLTLMTVIPDLRVMIEAEWSTIAYRDMADNARLRLQALTGEYPSAAGATIEVACGSIWRGILDAAERADADLIVLASHRPAMKDYLIGANAVSVVRHAACSVLVVRN